MVFVKFYEILSIYDDLMYIFAIENKIQEA